VQKFKLLQTSALIYIAFMSSNLWAEKVPTYGPIKQGDMLWTIAGKVSPPSVDRHQAILALQRANPHAFSISCNIYSLKIGEMLRIPRLATMQTVSREQAISELKRQEEEWKERRTKPIICSSIFAQPLELEKPKTTEQTGEANSSPDGSSEMPKKTPMENVNSPTVLSETTTHSQTPATTANMSANDTQTVSLLKEEEKEHTPTPLERLINRTLLISGILFAIFLLAIGGWVFKRKRAEIKAKEKETLAQSTFSEPMDEMPLPIETQEKSSVEPIADKPLPVETQEKSLVSEPIAEKPLDEKPLPVETQEKYSVEPIAEKPLPVETQEKSSASESIAEKPLPVETQEKSSASEPIAEKPLPVETQEKSSASEPIAEKPLDEKPLPVETQEKYSASESISEKPLPVETQEKYSASESISEKPLPVETQEKYSTSEPIAEKPLPVETQEKSSASGPMPVETKEK
jgi:FimV-like protein